MTIQPYNGEHVLLTGPASQNATIWVFQSSGVRIQGFDISDPTGKSGGIMVEDSRDVDIRGNTIHTGGHQGILVTGTGSTAPTYSSNVQIWNNTFFQNGGYWASSDSYWTVGDHAIYYGATSSDTDGIQHGAVGGVIANNLFYDQPYGDGIQVGSQNDGLIITNNTFDNTYQPDSRAGNAIEVYGEFNQFATKNVVIVNNIIADSAHHGVWGCGPNMTSNVVENNLGYHNPDGDFVTKWGSSTIFTLGPGNISGQNPLFVNAGGHDYHLAPGSPAIGKANPAYAPAFDFAGKARSSNPDLGAFTS
jgi:hypothetical protein